MFFFCQSLMLAERAHVYNMLINLMGSREQGIQVFCYEKGNHISLIFSFWCLYFTFVVPFSFHRVERFGGRLCIWICPINGWGKGPTQPPVSLSNCPEYHPQELRYGWKHRWACTHTHRAKQSSNWNTWCGWTNIFVLVIFKDVAVMWRVCVCVLR